MNSLLKELGEHGADASINLAQSAGNIAPAPPHKPTGGRRRPAIYVCSSYNAKLPNCL